MRIYRRNQIPCPVIGVTYRYDKFITQGKDRVDRLNHRIVITDGITDEGETGNFHGSGCWIKGRCASDRGYRIQDTGYRIQDTGCRMQDAGYKMLDAQSLWY
ncbi:MAG: hypothetical protein M0Q38_08725 [Bacteroidales bacterium]|nr:hypothetical protein [Bacteroidales bacterium]